ncbi:MAG: hypothetical protein JW818_22550 [Pirellulales bacterium]|nr:hypothetical protein [Pirellulales bacterium]
MKAISAAIVLLAGAVLFAVGSTAVGDSQSGAQALGIIIGCVGMYVWVCEMRRDHQSETRPNDSPLDRSE